MNNKIKAALLTIVIATVIVLGILGLEYLVTTHPKLFIELTVGGMLLAFSGWMIFGIWSDIYKVLEKKEEEK